MQFPLFAVLLCVCLSAQSLHAQVGEYRSALAIGVNGGYNLNKVSFDPTVKQNYHGGLTGGLTVRYTCERYFKMLCAVQAEVNYAQLGWKEKIETSADTYSRTVNYVQVPLLARLGFGREERGVMGYLVLGPQLGFYLSDSDKRTGEWSAATLALRPNNVVEQYDLPIQRTFEYGITGGLGMEVNTRHAGHYMLEGRYYFALSDMFRNGKSDAFGRSANGTIVAKVTYLFDLFNKKN
ncbi:MAG: PorT family protein [Bacteroidaceae bacterium]|nr:PorT family protein [Bacteroidaceae bacterium]